MELVAKGRPAGGDGRREMVVGTTRQHAMRRRDDFGQPGCWAASFIRVWYSYRMGCHAQPIEGKQRLIVPMTAGPHTPAQKIFKINPEIGFPCEKNR
jgi:hypothetical protein